MMYGPGQVLPFDKRQSDYWASEILRAERLRDDKLTGWKVTENLERYECKPDGQRVNDGSDFADSERKKAGLFYDTPYITVMPDPEGNPSIAVLHQELLNTVLDEAVMNAKGVALKAIQECLIAIQPSPTKIGYVPTIVEVPQTDPILKLPKLDDRGQPVMTPVVVHEEFFWSKISARALLLPIVLRDTDYDRVAPWLGYKFRMPVSHVRRAYRVPETMHIPAASGEQELYFTDKDIQPAEAADDPLCTGTYLEYKASLVDPKVAHPGLIRCLVLIDGMDQPIKHEDAPWLIDPVTKQFNPRSGFTGFSIHPLALRDLPDSAWVPADSTITSGLTDEITDFLEDIKRQRQSNRLAVFYDPSLLPSEMVERIEAGKAPGFIPVKPGSLQQGEKAVAVQISNLTSGREHYLGMEIFQTKREKVLGITANTVGGQDEGDPTATEITHETRNTEARFEQERQRAVGSWYLSGVRKVSAFLVRYGDKLALEVLGPQRGQAWVQARNQGLLNRFSFSVQIDGGKYLDIRAERKSHLDLYNLTAKDPNVNRVPVLRKVFTTFGYDAAECVVDKLPDPTPEPPKIAFSVSAADLNPALPQFPFVIDVLRQGGLKFSIEATQLAQLQVQALALVGRSPITAESANDPIEMMTGGGPMPAAGVGPDPKAASPAQHGGAADTTDRINQHQLAQTGNRSGPTVN